MQSNPNAVILRVFDKASPAAQYHGLTFAAIGARDQGLIDLHAMLLWPQLGEFKREAILAYLAQPEIKARLQAAAAKGLQPFPGARRQTQLIRASRPVAPTHAQRQRMMEWGF